MVIYGHGPEGIKGIKIRVQKEWAAAVLEALVLGREEGATGAPAAWLSHRRQVSKRLKKKSKQDEKLSCIDYFESIETKACIQILKVSFKFLNTHAHV